MLFVCNGQLLAKTIKYETPISLLILGRFLIMTPLYKAKHISIDHRGRTNRIAVQIIANSEEF